jgi:hypothetical protein
MACERFRGCALIGCREWRILSSGRPLAKALSGPREHSRALMAERSSWAGSAADLLRAGANRSRDDVTVGGPGWPKNPRALAGRLRRAQSFLRALGIDVTFGREGRAGSRVIRIHGTVETTVSTVSVGDRGYDRSEDKLSWERRVSSATKTVNPV